MANPTDLKGAQSEALRHLKAIEPGDYGRSTPCAEWTVRDLVLHLLNGSKRAETVLSPDSGSAKDGEDEPDDAELADALAESFANELKVFERPGALQVTFSGPRGEMDGDFLCNLRTMDTLLHAWDLARSAGGDDALPPELVEAVWAVISSPRAEPLLASGAFGSGRSGTVSEDAPLQQRLLDMSGRRP